MATSPVIKPTVPLTAPIVSGKTGMDQSVTTFKAPPMPQTNAGNCLPSMPPITHGTK